MNLDGTRPDFVLLHSEAVDYARQAMTKFGIEANKEQPFDAAIAEKASEAKPEKMNAAEVLSVDAATKKFRIKFRQKEAEVTTIADTVIKKGKDQAEFGSVVAVGAKVNLEILNGVAVSITAKK